jgi:dTDP-4-dehydrorhamnose 3,5-epimerase
MGDVEPDVRSAVKDDAHMSRNWDVAGERIDGVVTREVKNVITGNGVTTELFRTDWGIAQADVTAIIHVSLRPGAVSAWHMHRLQTDHLFTIAGSLRLALYDARELSPTSGRLDLLNLSPMRPTLLVIPPGVWHGLKSLGPEAGCFVNFFDKAYDYGDPDSWRLPPDTDEIPYRF